MPLDRSDRTSRSLARVVQQDAEEVSEVLEIVVDDGWFMPITVVSQYEDRRTGVEVDTDSNGDIL